MNAIIPSVYDICDSNDLLMVFVRVEPCNIYNDWLVLGQSISAANAWDIHALVEFIQFKAVMYNPNPLAVAIAARHK